MRESRVRKFFSRSLSLEVAVVLHQRPGDALHAGTGLTGRAAAVDADGHVDRVADFAVLQRGDHGVAVLGNAEELFEFAVVDGDLAAAGLDAHAGDRGLATASAEGFFRGGAGMRRIPVGELGASPRLNRCVA